MKIITNDKVYIQKYDLKYFVNVLHESIPKSLYDRYFGENGDTITDSNKYEFIELTDTKERLVFINDKRLLSYDEVKDKSEDELIDEIYRLNQKMAWDGSRAAFFKSSISAITPDDKEKNERIGNEIEKNVNTMAIRITSIKRYLDYKNRRLKMNFPKEIDCKPEKRLTLFFKNLNKNTLLSDY